MNISSSACIPKYSHKTLCRFKSTAVSQQSLQLLYSWKTFLSWKSRCLHFCPPQQQPQSPSACFSHFAKVPDNTIIITPVVALASIPRAIDHARRASASYELPISLLIMPPFRWGLLKLSPSDNVLTTKHCDQRLWAKCRINCWR